MKRLIKFFSSIKLAIILLICLACTSILGTFIAQKQNPAAYIKYFGEVGYRFLNFLDLFDVYHSWWFITLLVLLSINIMFCALRRLNRDIKRNKGREVVIDESKAKTYKLYHHRIFNKPFTQSKDIIISRLKGIMKGTLLEKRGENGEVHLFAEKHRYNWTFFHLTHISILIILLGGIFSAIYGVKGYVKIVEGESAEKFYEYDSTKTRDLGFRVKCDKFEIEYYPDSRSPKDYKSWLTIIDEGKEVMQKVIEVNKPLTYKGITLYQSSYGNDAESGTAVIEVTPKDPNSTESPREFKTRFNTPFEFTGHDGKSISVQIVNFYPDFMLDEQRRPLSRSDQLNNPAILLQINEGDDEPYLTYSFLWMPDPHMSKRGDYIFKFKDMQTRAYTGLQVGKDPGVWIVWLGCILLMIGVILVLFTSHKRVWVTMVPNNTGFELSITGFADKNKYAFESQFNDLLNSVDNLLTKTLR